MLPAAVHAPAAPTERTRTNGRNETASRRAPQAGDRERIRANSRGEASGHICFSRRPDNGAMTAEKQHFRALNQHEVDGSSFIQHCALQLLHAL